MIDNEPDVNEEEAWLHGVIKDFDYIVCSGKYGPLFYKMLSDQAKLIISNMQECQKRELSIFVDGEEYATRT